MADGQMRQGIVAMGQAVLSAVALSSITAYATTAYERGHIKVEILGVDGADNSLLGYAYAVAFENLAGTVSIGTPSSLWTMALGGTSLGAPTVAVGTSGGSIVANVTPANTRTQRWFARMTIASVEEAYA